MVVTLKRINSSPYLCRKTQNKSTMSLFTAFLLIVVAVLLGAAAYDLSEETIADVEGAVKSKKKKKNHGA